ncbi:molybdate ABC transporter substrate-binding protein [Tessaracoccus sp. OS52]|uniref:molybdate ABC transporter substrate-binding protein n=1 Tax=Tessaracoccus sp. OS52 TaxID=2886691 RepID=UPI001D117B9D|nr:molybdate ABC transporter substrate-binding protein [Tessaracoccus sp. OS52]MCC2593707.1 molybdate ABC transporter substrate-binding protein [Tessaracoccus sp. OS52]
MTADRSRRRVVALLAAVTPLVTACAAHAEQAPVVLAAASLAGPFEEIAQTQDIEVAFSFDGSAALVDQLAGGAPADVFAAADTATMERAVEAGLTEGDPVRLATNVLVLVTPPGNPAGITGLDDSLAGAKLVVCAPEVPCGRATAALADDLGVRLSPVSEETKVTDVLGKVTSGEADAGFVYATDAAAAGDAVDVIDVPAAEDHPNEYWIVSVRGGSGVEAAAFIEVVTSTDGQAVLAARGFGAP